MEFLVAVGDFAVCVDPEEGIFDSFAGWVVAGFVDADGDGEAVLFGFLL